MKTSLPVVTKCGSQTFIGEGCNSDPNRHTYWYRRLPCSRVRYVRLRTSLWARNPERERTTKVPREGSDVLTRAQLASLLPSDTPLLGVDRVGRVDSQSFYSDSRWGRVDRVWSSLWSIRYPSKLTQFGNSKLYQKIPPLSIGYTFPSLHLFRSLSTFCPLHCNSIVLETSVNTPVKGFFWISSSVSHWDDTGYLSVFFLLRSSVQVTLLTSTFDFVLVIQTFRHPNSSLVHHPLYLPNLVR